MKKIQNRNEKGSVLVTVLGVTLICMILAALAISIAAYSNKQSNINLRKTQALLTAEGCLKQIADPSTGIPSDKLEELANGTDKDNPKHLILGGVDSALAKKCDVYIYTSFDDAGNPDGIVIKVVAEFAGEEQSACAFFSGAPKKGKKGNNNNVIETNGLYSNGSDGEFAYTIGGDAMFDIPEVRAKLPSGVNINDATDEDRIKAAIDSGFITTFHNSNGRFTSNMYTTASLNLADSTDVLFADTERGFAPTITAWGDIILGQNKFGTVVGKTGKDGQPTTEEADFTNRDGYIHAGGKIIIEGTNSGLNVGCEMDSEKGTGGGGTTTVQNPIDIYCHGMEISDNATKKIYGNVYCDGDININSNADGLIITGDLYLGKGHKISDETKMIGFIKGHIITDYDFKTGTNRDNFPRLDYAPGMLDRDDFENTKDCDVFLPSNYTEYTPNDIYQGKGDAARIKLNGGKTLKQAYKDAIGNEWSGSGSITKSCKIVGNKDEFIGNGDANFDSNHPPINIEIQDNNDIVVLLPTHSNSTTDPFEINRKIRVDKKGDAKGICYFMFYDPSSSENYYEKDSNKTLLLRNCITVTDKNSDAAFLFSTKDFAKDLINKYHMSGGSIFITDPSKTVDEETNIFFLIPDGFQIDYGSGMVTKIQGIFYGPKSKFNWITNNQDFAMYGQFKFENFLIGGNTDQSVFNCRPAEGTILDQIAGGAGGSGGGGSGKGVTKPTFQYYMKHD